MFGLDPMRQDISEMMGALEEDLSSVRTGRAKPSLVENIMVEAYGGTMKLLEVAGISAPESTLIVVKPWDTTLLSAVEKAIQASGLGVHPVVDGQQIRIAIPPLTGERREELARLVSQKQHLFEDMLRDIRTKYKKQIDSQKGQPGVSEDDIKRDLEALQKLTDESMKKISDVAEKKQNELKEM